MASGSTGPQVQRLIEKCEFASSVLDSATLRAVVARHDEWLRLHQNVKDLKGSSGGEGDEELGAYLVKQFAGGANGGVGNYDSPAVPRLTAIQKFQATSRAVYIGRRWKTSGYDHRDVELGLPHITRICSIKAAEETAVRELAGKLDSWDFDVLELDAKTGNNPLLALAWMCFSEHKLFKDCDIPADKATAFFTALQRGYLSGNPYHNAIHAADVVQAVHTFIVEGCSERLQLSPVEVMSMLLAAAVHDYKHPGRNNAFSVARRDELAITYNDTAVLENFHIAEAYRLMAREQTNVLETLNDDEQKQVRQIIIQTVLATDMATHFNHLADFKVLVAAPPEELTPQNRSLAMMMALHTADVSNAAKPKATYLEWVTRVMTEFYSQGEAERGMGLPVSPFMDRTKPAVKKCQQGFIGFIVGPLFEAWGTFLPSMKETFKANLKANKEHWDDDGNVKDAETAINNRTFSVPSAAPSAGAIDVDDATGTAEAGDAGGAGGSGAAPAESDGKAEG